MKEVDFVIYHGGCNDGFCAALILHKFFPDAIFSPAWYGQDPPDVTNKKVAVVDFSYEKKTLERMREEAQDMIVLDHHKTAEEELKGLDYCIFDMNKSGATLTWEFFCGGPAPWIVKYVEDRDLWRWKLPGSKQVSAVLFSLDYDFDQWREMSKRNVSEIIVEGNGILRYQDKLVSIFTKDPIFYNLAGYRVPFVNSSTLFSEIGAELSKDHPFAVVFCFIKDKVLFSLRSSEVNKDSVDVSEIAKNFSGGGHKHAAGFQLSFSEARSHLPL